jgi:hypothetical protein
MEVWGGNRIVDAALAVSGLDAWVYSRPHGGAGEGGDVLYLSSCATGRITRILVADVSGHGTTAAGLAKALRGLMAKHVNRLDQDRFVSAMNVELASVASSGSFATAVVMTYFAPTRDLTVSNAGHPPPFIYRSSAREWSLLQARASAPLGMFEESQYQRFGTVLEPGDLVLAYSDAFVEARGAEGKVLGPRGLLEVARGIGGDSPETFVSRIRSAVEGLRSGNLESDDVTALVFRPSPAKPTKAMRRGFAPAKVLRGLARSLRTREPAPWPEVSVPNLLGGIIPAFNWTWRRKNLRRR